MHSIRDVHRLLGEGVTEAWIRKWIRVLGLGRKCGWAVILSDSEVNMLREKLSGRQKAA
jgi:hypothetical protein